MRPSETPARRLHICFVCNEYPPAEHGGIGTFTQTLARELVQYGHQASCIGLYPIPQGRVEDDRGVHVIRLPLGTTPYLRIVTNYLRMQRAIRQLQRERPIDLLEGSDRSFFLVSSRLPIPKIIRMHGGHVFTRMILGQIPDRQKAMEERWSYRVATHVCACSRFVGETTRRRLRLGDRPIPVLPNPVDTEMFSPRDPAREEDGLILCVGKVVENKGIRQLLEAMPLVLNRFPGARLISYGIDTIDPASGRSFTELLRARIPPGYADRITLAGPVPRDRLPELMAKASVCVYPSHTEALPVAWVEALAMGKAVLASKIGPAPEVIEEGVSGIFCNPHDPASIAAGLIQLLGDPELRARLRIAARQRAESLFSLEKLVPQNLAYYEACLNGTVASLPFATDSPNPLLGC